MTGGAARLLLLCVLALTSSPAPAGDSVPEPEGYRNADYRSPTPSTLKGARVVGTPDAEALWTSGRAVFVDVMPRPPRPSGLPAGTIWREQPRPNIPGSIWLPDTGYGALAPVIEEYFRRGLEQAAGGDRATVLVFYCLENCWMSWNAARRAMTLGYSDVVWYPAGTDGWQGAGLPLEDGKPVPRPGE
ncbi:MAG: PQQ-dependent catabolism-associated CXXCW motif protein [Xanthobacteraceae bacterium]|jgi:PQQ-dependent catabolism-associated CXXCW motif protein